MTYQVQLKITLTKEIMAILKERAGVLGLPISKYVKHLVLEDIRYQDLHLTEAEVQNDKDDLDKLIRGAQRLRGRLAAAEYFRGRKHT